jgi:hypothetical protein
MRNYKDPFSVDLSKHDIRNYPDYRPSRSPLKSLTSPWDRPAALSAPFGRYGVAPTKVR